MNSVRPVFCVVRETGAVEKYVHEVGREMLRTVVLEAAEGVWLGNEWDDTEQAVAATIIHHGDILRDNTDGRQGKRKLRSVCG